MVQDWLIGELSWLRLLKSVVFVYTAVAIYVYFRADAMIFQPQAPSYEQTSELLKIPVTSTESIAAIYLPNPQAQWTILYSHGNASDLGDIRPVLEQLHSWGFAVLAYDYRGYGHSEGEPSENNAYADGLAAYKYLTETLKIPGQEIILFGHSLGGGVATALAEQVLVGGLVLEGTFTSVFRVVLPIPVFPFDKFPNQARLAQISVPVLIIHGEADEIVPFSHGQKLYETAPEPKYFLPIPQAGHNNVFATAPEQIKEALSQFTQALTSSHEIP